MNRVSTTAIVNEEKEEKQGVNSGLPLLVLFSVGIGIALSIIIVPGWIPGLVSSLQGEQPTVFWLLSRASALVSFGLLWLSMFFGLLITSKTARLWPGSPSAFDLHEQTSLLGMLFALFHGLLLLGDRYIGFQLLQITLPFASLNYRPLEVGLGQLAFYALLIVNVSFYIRKQISQAAWRALHWLSFLTFVFALLHGITAGTDSSLPAMIGFYWVASGSLLVLCFYRLILALRLRESKA